MSRVGGSGRCPVLVPRDLKWPLKNSTQKIKNTPDWQELIVYGNADLLVYCLGGVHLVTLPV